MEFEENSASESEDEYSEDEDFIAWKNDPEVQRRIKEQNKTRDEAINQNSVLKSKADKTELDAQVKTQVELLSSNLENHKFDPYLVREQNKLFQWREQFFYKKFGHHYTTEGMKTWFTDGGDDSHDSDTVPFQITKNFENVLMLASSKDLGKSQSSLVYFEHDEMLSYAANLRFNKNYDMEFVIETLLDTSGEETGLNFGDVAHMIVAEHSTAPPTLLEIAMKTVLLHKIPLHNEAQELPCKAVCCTSLKQKALKGLYRSSDNGIQENIQINM